jgi:hypothetical protein
MPRAGGGPQPRRRDTGVAADDEKGRANAQGLEQLAEALDGDLRHGALRALVEAQGKPVDGCVAAKPVQVDRDGPDQGMRRDSSCR